MSGVRATSIALVIAPHHNQSIRPRRQGTADMSRHTGGSVSGRSEMPSDEDDCYDTTNTGPRDESRASMIDGSSTSGRGRSRDGDAGRGASHGGAAAARKTSSAFQDRISSLGGGGSKASVARLFIFTALVVRGIMRYSSSRGFRLLIPPYRCSLVRFGGKLVNL